MGSGWLGLLAAGVAGIAVAQAPVSSPQGPIKDPGIKTVHMVRTTTAPVIDGKLKHVWPKAELQRLRANQADFEAALAAAIGES